MNKELLEKRERKQEEAKNSKDRKRKRQYEIKEDNNRDWENDVIEVKGMIKDSDNKVVCYILW